MYQSIDKVVIYGAGIRGVRLCKVLKDTDIQVIAIVDSDSSKWGTYVEGVVICSPNNMKELENYILCISVEDVQIIKSIRENLKAKGLYRHKQEIVYEQLLLMAYCANRELIQHVNHSIAQTNAKKSVIFESMNGLGLGGVECWTKDICSALLEDGRDNTFLVTKRGEYDVSESIQDKILYIDRKTTFSLEVIKELIEVYINKLPCKIVTSEVNEAMIAACVVKAKYLGLIEIISVMHSGNDRAYERYMSIEKYIDIFIGVSQEIRTDMLRLGIDDKKIYAMTCPFICEKELKRTYTINRREPLRIGYAGRIESFEKSPKRMDLLLAFSKMLDDMGVNFVFEIAGDGPARPEMEAFVTNNNLTGKVFFLGMIKRMEIADFWKKQDVFVNFSDYEGRCISKLEAMANGAVPITTNTVGTKEDIEDGISGFVVPVGDYKAMVEKVIYLDEHRESLVEMGAIAHERIYPKSLMCDHIRFWNSLL